MAGIKEKTGGTARASKNNFGPSKIKLDKNLYALNKKD
jgi:hypothetical protein